MKWNFRRNNLVIEIIRVQISFIPNARVREKVFNPFSRIRVYVKYILCIYFRLKTFCRILIFSILKVI